MQDDINSYFKDLGDMISTAVMTDSAGEKFSVFEGIEKAISIITAQTRVGQKIIFIGNGGSSSIASHMAVDFWKNGGMKAISFNDPAQLTCLSNDYGYLHVFEKPVRMFANEGDVLVAISSSGKSGNILKAVESARELGCKIITMSGFSPDNPLRYFGNMNFYVPSASYGFVEVIHQIFCHCILDLIIERKAEKLVEGAL